MPELEILHIHTNKISKNSTIYLLFIPLLAFILVLALFVSSQRGRQTASTSSPDVLGDEVKLDNNSTVPAK
ncbi:hypothetical protein A2V61_01530 [Candidatus Woesebacteria bacterium RBG_19FT_COMBO_47_8]|uniref:Uncharacterized protein n=1 Tax=Candidatus Woesebacteria bacterium RBG_13_46_13 TaxID=1802479 RepID=A0A1F7X5T7_9BACT|nr:MAG: hypothetical protein A2Y68_03350 [Candidatus Woesebacteria bacterium RBG_13_46_13]OGM17407.1 MAG: hypothetical protein A2V61_01530 [Candidatus Woesebacteria bacterium RBG_19FT_COMBO_47_8]HJX59594.1 hypothetical protein [Patescibacteria group bacterium]